METFSPTVQMVKAGFGDGLVPLGIALEMRLDRRSYRLLPGVRRHITLVTGKSVNQLAAFQRLRDALAQEAGQYFSQSASPPRR